MSFLNMRVRYSMRASLFLILLATSIYITITVVTEIRFIGFIKNQHSVLKGGRKTEDWIVTYASHAEIIEQYFMRRKTWTTSKLGSFLFKNINDTIMEKMKRPDRIFKVLIWRYGEWLKKSHQRYGDTWNLEKCSVDNCRFSGDFDFAAADAIVVHLQRGLIPDVDKRNPKQKWIMLTDESPRQTFSLAKHPPTLPELAEVFNWSMTFRSDSDIPVPYGRTLPLLAPKFTNISIEQVKDLVPYWSRKQEGVLASILISNCGVQFRNDFLNKLRNHIDIDIYGHCSTDEHLKKRCPGHVDGNCPFMSKYLFYLVLENAKCRQYISEKIYEHAFGKGAIPVIMGPPVEDCIGLLPPNSFLHVDDFKTPEELALEMVSISNNRDRLLSYHVWRNNFKVVSEHGYFNKPSFQLCRICEALNYNDDTQKVYKLHDMHLFLDPDILCSY